MHKLNEIKVTKFKNKLSVRRHRKTTSSIQSFVSESRENYSLDGVIKKKNFLKKVTKVYMII